MRARGTCVHVVHAGYRRAVAALHARMGPILRVRRPRGAASRPARAASLPRCCSGSACSRATVSSACPCASRFRPAAASAGRGPRPPHAPSRPGARRTPVWKGRASAACGLRRWPRAPLEAFCLEASQRLRSPRLLSLLPRRAAALASLASCAVSSEISASNTPVAGGLDASDRQTAVVEASWGLNMHVIIVLCILSQPKVATPLPVLVIRLCEHLMGTCAANYNANPPRASSWRW